MMQLGIYWNNQDNKIGLCYEISQKSVPNLLKARGYYTRPLATRSMLPEEVLVNGEHDHLQIFQYDTWQELMTDEYAMGFTRDDNWIKSLRRLMEMQQYARANAQKLL